MGKQKRRNAQAFYFCIMTQAGSKGSTELIPRSPLEKAKTSGESIIRVFLWFSLFNNIFRQKSILFIIKIVEGSK
jgi:hypothetical protein